MNKKELECDLLSLLPPWYREILDYQQICATEQSQMEVLAQEIAAVADNFFFQTMDAKAVAQWEQIFGIAADSSQTLTFRRDRLLNRVSTRPPYTMGFLARRLDQLIGPGAWRAAVDYPNHTLYIESSAEDQSYATEVTVTVNQMKPAHIVFINTPLVHTDIALSETVGLTHLTYNYRLGSWGLGLLPLASEESQGVIKTATTPSIQPRLLSDTADFLSGDVASARVNGELVISELSKNVEDCVLTITYPVTPEQAAEINRLELLDEEGNVLTASSVYVPITGATTLKHTILVKEGATANA